MKFIPIKRKLKVKTIIAIPLDDKDDDTGIKYATERYTTVSILIGNFLNYLKGRKNLNQNNKTSNNWL